MCILLNSRNKNNHMHTVDSKSMCCSYAHYKQYRIHNLDDSPSFKVPHNIDASPSFKASHNFDASPSFKASHNFDASPSFKASHIIDGRPSLTRITTLIPIAWPHVSHHIHSNPRGNVTMCTFLLADWKLPATDIAFRSHKIPPNKISSPRPATSE